MPDPGLADRRTYALYDPVKAQDALEKALGCKVYYTRAYASYEKGSVENCNRIVRRWYPKGTDFSLCAKADIQKLETGIKVSLMMRIRRETVTRESQNSFVATASSAEETRDTPDTVRTNKAEC